MKRLVKLLISLGVRVGDVVGTGCLRAMGRKSSGTCVILYYHPVTTSQRARFTAQMDILKRLTRPLRADSEEPLKPGNRYSAVTFDDAYVSVAENALPALKERGIPCTIFVPAGSLGGPPKWVRDPSHPFTKERVMSAQEIEGLKGDALVSIGSHSISHPNFLTLSEEDARMQFSEPKAMLEDLIGTPVPTFSFPHGAHNSSLLEMARTTGYQRVFTIEPEQLISLSDRFTCGRVLVDPNDWPLEFRLKLLGAYRWMAWVSRRLRSSDPERDAVPCNHVVES